MNATSPYALGEWMAQSPVEFRDRQYVMRRTATSGYRVVRAYRGVVVRRVAGKDEYDRCPHAHTKRGAARQCAEKAARRLNRANTQPQGEA